MKRAMTAMGLGTLAVMAVLGVFSVGSASAQTLYLFLFGTGTPLPALVLILSNSKQIFHVLGSTGLGVECSHFIGQGKVSNGSAMYGSTGKINGNYSTCTLLPGGTKANVSEAEYEVDAQGSVKVLKTIDIAVPSTGCLILVDTANTHLLTISYINLPTVVLGHVNISGIHSIIHTPGACGTTEVLSTTGTYTGLLLVRADGGTMQWMG